MPENKKDDAKQYVNEVIDKLDLATNDYKVVMKQKQLESNNQARRLKM